jgi:S1-C subfamily serine protease
MANKVIIGILALLVVIAGGTGYYSYTLNQQVNRLDVRLKASEAEQAARLEAISSEVGILWTDTQASLGLLKEQIADVKSDVSTMESGLGAAEGRISGLEEATDAIESGIEDLDKRISNVEIDISRSLVDAGKVYEEVSRATVRITNGNYTAGSGFIFDEDGHVVTAYHVVQSLTPIYVMMDDGRITRASTLGYCPFSDVAVLSLESNLAITPPVIGDSSLLRIGEPVIAIGSPGPGDSNTPLGWKDTLTSGVLSQINRFVDIEGLWLANMLQFDAAINFGNSGCPLANSRGEIIGLVTARIDPAQGDGINWAVSSNKVRRVAEAIINNGSFDYPWIGTGIADLSPQIVQDNSLETANGVLVTAVFANSPAEIGGVKTNDVIVAVDGIPVGDSGYLTSYLGEYKSPGDEMTIEVIRGGDIIYLSVEVGKRQP